MMLKLHKIILFLSKWLQGFAYKVDIGMVSFLAGGFIAFFIAFITVGFQSLIAAMTNPVNALRSE